MNSPAVAMWLIGIVVAAASALTWWISWSIRRARKWPMVDATIESAGMGKVGSGRRAADVPCFAFSYVVNGRNYSGHFALRADKDRAENLMRQMVDKKMAIHYDPKWPAGWYIPVDKIGGCDVLQKVYQQANSEEAKG